MQQKIVHRRLRHQRLSAFVFLVILCIGLGWRLTIVPHGNQYYVDYDGITEKSFFFSSTAADDSITKPPQQFTLSDGTVVSVGQIGPKIAFAQQHRLPQRNLGSPWQQWDIIGNSTCLHDNDKSSFASLTPNSSPPIVRKHWLPQAILIGVQKGGTTALYQYMDQHPNITKSGKELYFMDETVDKVMLEQHERDQAEGIPMVKVRQLYSRRMKEAVKQSETPIDDKMLLDWTPNYLFQSDRLPARIACLVPWAKIMVLLRNPVDRARSQYDMKLRVHAITARRRKGMATGRTTRKTMSFQDYIQNDLAALLEAGVIQDWNKVDFDLFFDSPAMDEAWKTYINCGMNAPIGMGLYAIQLKPFLALNQDFLAIQSEKLARDTDATYGQVLDFLGLERISLEVYLKANHATKKQKTTVDQETEEMLRKVFAPYNRKLGELLGKEWEGVWQEDG
jgi:Sulfotransferase domain